MPAAVPPEVSVGDLTSSLWLNNLYPMAEVSVRDLTSSLWLNNLYLKAEVVQLVSSAPKRPPIARALKIACATGRKGCLGEAVYYAKARVRC